MLKVTGILLIIGAAFVILFQSLAISGNAILLALDPQDAQGWGAITTPIFIIAVISGIVQLVAGILGIRNSDKQQNAMQCVIAGTLAILLVFASTFVGGFRLTVMNVLALVLGLLVPALYLYAAIKMWRSPHIDAPASEFTEAQRYNA